VARRGVTSEVYARHKPCVYFAQHVRRGFIKIGTTTNLKMRMGDIICIVRDPREVVIVYPPSGEKHVQLLGIMLGGRTRENQLHKRFADHRLDGEWFQPHPNILNFIRKWTVPYDVEGPLPKFVKITGKRISAIVDADVWDALRDLAQRDGVPFHHKMNEVLKSVLLSESVAVPES
jgi:hypothetical protein